MAEKQRPTGWTDDFVKQVDEWVIESNKHIGEVSKGTQLNNELVTADLIRHYADAIGDKNPLWRNEEYAKGTRWGGIIAPPKIIDCVGAAEGRYNPSKHVPGLQRGLVGGTRWEWFKVIRPGDKFHVVGTFLGVRETESKKERPYRVYPATNRSTYINQKDEIVAIGDFTVLNIVTPGEAPLADAYGDKKGKRKNWTTFIAAMKRRKPVVLKRYSGRMLLRVKS
jgi:acyl dehydratase